MDQTPLSKEPVRLTTAATAATVATINVLAVMLDWSGELVAGLNVAVAAWVGVLGAWIRSKVTPVASMKPPEFA
jgi:hypothetical protein|tara:strand:+ start:3825 stop:4046 length:222 start_codon:yes stop_codon:yes gene_type:complete